MLEDLKTMDIAEPLLNKKSSTAQKYPMLQALAEVAERSPLELGVTLNIKGLIITGFIISQSNYFESLISGLKDTDQDSEIKDSLLEFLSGLKEKLAAKSEQKNSHEFPRFIHLRNVKIYPSEGRGMPTYGDALWRGIIDSVDGFSLGEMVPAQFESITASK
jgi:hypothetical protein